MYDSDGDGDDGGSKDENENDKQASRYYITTKAIVIDEGKF